MKSLAIFILITFQFYCYNCKSQSSLLKPGFDKLEFIELLKVSSRQGDSLYNPDLPAPQKFKKIYRSTEMVLDNRWDLWMSDDKTACISIRGTTTKQVSWLDNFYAAMVPAKGSLQLSKDFKFDYHLCDDEKAAVHTGWLIATAFLSKDIIPKIDSIYAKGTNNIYIIGHSQGAAISYLLTAYLLNLQKENKLSKKIVFKTYCSAAPKPGNLHFAYAYEYMTRGGWSLTVVNSADWVAEAPFSIQTTTDFNPVNPFYGAKNAIKKAPFFKRIAMNYFYNSLVNPTKKANKQFQKNLGKNLEKFIKKSMPEFQSPKYFNSSNYSRTGENIVLYADSSYYKLFPIEREKIWTHHAFEPYLYLADKYNLSNDNSQNNTSINIEVSNYKTLDSFVIYDKSQSWKIISSLKFNKQNVATAILQNIENKAYQLFIFNNGKQEELGNILLSRNVNVTIQFDENNPPQTIKYEGDNFEINNFYAFTFAQQNLLNKTLGNFILQNELEILFNEKKQQIIEESNKLKIDKVITNSAIENYNQFCNTLLEKKIKQQYRNSLNAKIGNKFTFLDTDGKSISLDKFSGKYVYLDVWATWCKPCIMEYPFLINIEKEFHEKDNFQIVAVSIDKDFNKWKPFVTSKKMDFIQLHATPDSDFVNFYGIGSLPRYILLDPKGMILNSEEIRPSDPELKTKLEVLLSKK